jgi:dienelactone hydrolase
LKGLQKLSAVICIRPNTPETCEAEMMKYATNRPLLRQRARRGFDELRKVSNTDLSKLAAIGYCFGGMVVLEMASASSHTAKPSQ